MVGSTGRPCRRSGTGSPGAQARRRSPALEAITGFHEGFGVDAIEVEWVEIEQVGNTVWNERIDSMIDAAGEHYLAIPLAGCFRFDDTGRLVAWHDYWDMRPLLATAAPAGWPRAAGRGPWVGVSNRSGELRVGRSSSS